MKYAKILRIFASALVLSLILSLIPSAVALAAGNLYVYTADEVVEVGEEIVFWGTDFDPEETYDFYFSNENASTHDDIDEDVVNYEDLGYTTTAAEGHFTHEFTVPDKLTDGDDTVKVYGGTYYIYATYHGDEEIKAKLVLEVESEAVITIDPDNGTVGSEIEIDGEGYEVSEDITVEFDGSDVDIVGGDEDTDSDGEFSGTVIVIPEGAAGTHTVTVIGKDSELEAIAEFTIEPKITVSPESGPSGTEITVTGTGFGEDMDVAISFAGDGIDVAETDDDGNFTAQFNIPAATSDQTYTIEAEDDDDNTAEAEFTVAETIFSIDPATGTAGTEIKIGGSGFKPNTSLTITFNNASIGNYTTDASGNIPTITYTVPSLAVGEYSVKATDGTNSGEKKFTISNSATIVPATSSSSPGYVGSQLTASGSGYNPGGTITVKYDSIQIATGSVDSGGSFSIPFTVPASSSGDHTILVSDGINSQTFNFHMESSAPGTPQPLKPEMNVKAPAEAYFDWEAVTDESLPVTYTLQIATSDTFSADSMVLEKTGLTETEYKLTSEERLNNVTEEAPYYWRLRAVDAASNAGDWTGTGTFIVGFSFGISQALIYVIIAVCAIALAVFAFWMGRKTAYY